jgi:hypothetical protein
MCILHITDETATAIYTRSVSCYKFGMADEPLDQRLQLVISKGQISAVDDWRRVQPDLPSRSEAIRRLIEAGLSVQPTSEKTRRKSSQ